VCSRDTDEILQVVVECERAFRKGGFSWAAFIFSFLFLPIKVLHWEEEVTFGQDKVYLLPVPVCQGCREDLRGERAMKEGLRQIAVYDRLLNKFPEAKIRQDR
jgi:hypothetical protein